MSQSQSRSTPVTCGNAQQADPPIREARLTIDAPDLAVVGIADLVALWREAGLRDFDALACEATGAVVQVHVEEPLPQRQVRSLDCVDRSAHVSETAGGELYVVEFTAPRFPPSAAVQRTELLDTCDLDLHDDGLSFSLVGPIDSVSAAIADLKDDGLAPTLLRVGPYTGREGPLETLTDRQREVVTTAYYLGYYEVPRTVSAAEVAAELGLEPSTVSEHLQRAERNFLTRQLAAPRY